MRLDEIKIPEIMEETLYVCVCLDSNYDWEIGKVTIGTRDKEDYYKEDEEETWKTLVSNDVVIEIPRLDMEECKGVVVDSLECQKDKELADHFVKMQGLQEKIDSLLAIEYKPEEITVVGITDKED